MISSLKTTRFVVQLSPHEECSAEKFDKTFSFTCFIRLYSLVLFYWDQPFQSKPDLIETVKAPEQNTFSTVFGCHAVVSEHSHFQTSSTSFAKVCKKAKG